MAYDHSVEQCSVKILQKFHPTVSLELRHEYRVSEFNIFNIEEFSPYLLWMLSRIKNMKKGDNTQAARWIGYVQGVMECHGLITNEESRNMIRKDKELGNI